MNNLPKQFQNKVDDLAVDLIGEDHVTVRNGLIEFAQEYAKYRLEEFIADHFPEDSPKNTSSISVDDIINWRNFHKENSKVYKTGINIPKEDELPKPPLQSKFEIYDEPTWVEVDILGAIVKMPIGFYISSGVGGNVRTIDVK